MVVKLTQEEVFRYSRHLMIPEVGLEGQKKLKSTSVLVVGAGGLGSPVALYLAAAGIGHIGLVDDDVVDASNLQRQILHDTLHQGQPKATSGRQRMLALNPMIDVTAYVECFNEKTAERIADGYDILVDCSDNFSTRYLVNDLCVLSGKPDVSGAIYRFEGQVSVFDARFGTCYRCLFPEPPPPELSPSCAEAGVFGVLPGVVGSLQATEVLKIALGIGTPLYGALMIYDALEASFQILRLQKNEECLVCGGAPQIRSLQDSSRFCADDEFIARADDETISPDELNEQLHSANPPLLLDVRRPVEKQISDILGSVLIPLEQLSERMNELPKSGEIVPFCRTGKRSARAVRLLKENGFECVKNLSGGINAWVKKIDPGQYIY